MNSNPWNEMEALNLILRGQASWPKAFITTKVFYELLWKTEILRYDDNPYLVFRNLELIPLLINDGIKLPDIWLASNSEKDIRRAIEEFGVDPEHIIRYNVKNKSTIEWAGGIKKMKKVAQETGRRFNVIGNPPWGTSSFVLQDLAFLEKIMRDVPCKRIVWIHTGLWILSSLRGLHSKAKRFIEFAGSRILKILVTNPNYCFDNIDKTEPLTVTVIEMDKDSPEVEVRNLLSGIDEIAANASEVTPVGSSQGLLDSWRGIQKAEMLTSVPGYLEFKNPEDQKDGQV